MDDVILGPWAGGVHVTAPGTDRARLHTAGMAKIRGAKSGLLPGLLHKAQAKGPDRAVQSPPRAASGDVPKDAAPMDGPIR